MRLTAFVGYDPREDLAYRVCRQSLIATSKGQVQVYPLKLDNLRPRFYTRTSYVEDGQAYDSVDTRPYSTEFSFSRFLAPVFGKALDEEWVLFCDSDFLWRSDPMALLGLANPHCACMVVKHVYAPMEAHKMRESVRQQAYQRKNWSSMVLWNCKHPSTGSLTPYEISHRPGSWLHGFRWLQDSEIGQLSEEWNWIPGHSPEQMSPAAVHYTLGTPDVDGHRNDAYAEEWRAVEREVWNHGEL